MIDIVFCVLELYKEYDVICYQYQISLRRPLIEIREKLAPWGMWNENERKIILSYELIEKHSWDTVISIFKHEIAHQYVSEYYPYASEPHGKEFIFACQKLGVSDFFKQASIELKTTDLLNNELLQSPMKRKLEKLLALSHSSNEHEAKIALSAAEKISKEYNLSLCQEKEPFDKLTIYTHKKRLSKIYSSISGILQDFYFVTPIISEAFDPRLKERFKTIELVGRRENLFMAEYVYLFLMRKIEEFWEEYKGSHKASFQVGLLDGFRKSLEKNQKKEDSSLCNALIVLEKQLIAATQYFFPKTKTRSHKSSHHAHDFEVGKKKGAEILIPKPLSKKETYLIES